MARVTNQFTLIDTQGFHASAGAIPLSLITKSLPKLMTRLFFIAVVLGKGDRRTWRGKMAQGLYGKASVETEPAACIFVTIS